MLLNIVTPNKKLIVNEEVCEVMVPANRGELTVYPGHSPLITTLEIGVLKYKKTESDPYSQFAISWGYCEISGNEIKILAEKAESSKEIDKSRSEEALKVADSKLSNFKELTIDDISKYTNKLKRAETRISISELKK